MSKQWIWAVALVMAGPASGQVAPLTLDRAVDIALEQSRDVHDARLEVESARRRVREAWGNVFPQVNATAQYTRNLTVQGSFLPRIFFDPDAGPDELVLVKFGSDNMWNFSLRADQPLFRAAAFIGVGAAARYEALQREMLRGRTQDVVTRVRISFYDVLLAEESVRLTENTVERIRRTLDEMQRMERAGIASNYDVLRLEVELANVEPALRRARNAASAARRSLAIELGLPDLDAVQIEGSLLGMQPDTLAPIVTVGANGDGSVALQDAVRQRSEVRQLELTESLRQAELRAQQSEYLPEITLFGTYALNAQQSGSPVFFGSEANRSYGRQVGVMVSMPLFSGFQRPQRIAQQRLLIQQLRTQRDVLEDRVEHEVRTYADQVEESRQRATAQRLAVRQAQRGYEIATVQYREGISSALELTDAESALRQSEFNYAEAIYDYLVARARLEGAVGLVDTTGRGATRTTRGVER